MTKEKVNELVITREFNAPRQLVFDAFTQAKHLAHWWGPVGFTLKVLKLEVCAGGVFHYSMEAVNGHKMWGLFNYIEIEAPGKIVFTSSFADEYGNSIPAPFSADFPQKVMNVWTFEEQNGKTTLTLRGGPVNPTEAQSRFYEGMHPSMQQGFKGTFDQLESYLEKINK
ncbi:MAG: SRPBCC domain-containing protein [Bacteroidia bacterium]|jgi:uncharacterized protein YndB with AHSA1/START domain